MSKIHITNRIHQDPKQEIIAEKVARWRLNASVLRGQAKQWEPSSDAKEALANAKIYEACAKELEEADTSYLLCPVAELKGQYGVVLFFKDEKDSRELIDAVKQAKPNMIERSL